MKQADLEREMHRLGLNRYRAKTANHRRLKAETYSAGGRRLLEESLKAYGEGLGAWITQFKNNRKATIQAQTATRMDDLPRTSLVALSARMIVDGIALARPYTSTAISIGGRLEDEARYRKMKSTHADAWRRSQRRYKGAGGRQRKLAQLHDEKHFWGDDPWDRWPKEERLRIGSACLEIFQQTTGLIRFELRRTQRQKRGPYKGTKYVVATEDTLKWLENANEYHEVLYPVWLPCVIPPAPWKSLWGGGYHTDVVIRRPMIKTTDRQLLNSLEGADLEEVYSAITAIQNTPWQINREVFEVFAHFWELGVPVAGMPSRDDEEVPAKPHDIETNEQARREWSKVAARIRRSNERQRSVRVGHARLKFIVDMLEDRRIWFPWKADWRGRLYPIPSFLNPQGDSLARGLLRFADGCSLEDPEALRWWTLHGANCWGFDKVSHEKQVAWVQIHTPEILEVHRDPIANRWWTEADKPWEFLAWCLEFGDRADDPQGFRSHVPVAMDGSNNGLQIFSLLLRDRVGAASTNVTYSEHPRDIYQDVADHATGLLQQDAAAGKKWARTWLSWLPDQQIPRACAKRPVMTLPYGATKFSAIHYIREWFMDELGTDDLGEASPFDDQDGYRPCTYLAHLIWQSIHEVVIAARDCMAWLQEIAKICVEHQVVMRWTVPSGFVAQQKYLRWRDKKVYTAVGDCVRYPILREDTEELHPKQMINGISPNYIHSLDAAVLVKVVNASVQEGIVNFSMVHDSYATTAADAPALARILREQYAEMFSADLLQDFRAQVLALLPRGVDLPPVPPMGDLDVNEVRSAAYFFS